MKKYKGLFKFYNISFFSGLDFDGGHSILNSEKNKVRITREKGKTFISGGGWFDGGEASRTTNAWW